LKPGAGLERKCSSPTAGKSNPKPKKEKMPMIPIHKLKAAALSCLMSFLFFGGLIVAGSEWEIFPWGQVIGILMLVSFLLVLKWIERRERKNGIYEN
jgi:hypothetical protein